MSLIHGLHFNNLKGDLLGGVTAAVVALPLALAFGVSSGAGAIAGLYGAIFVGLFAALFGGTPAQVSGPTGPMTVVMASVFTQFVAIDPATGPVLAFTVVIMGGILQMLFGLLKLGKYVTLVPFPVISGFMSGIGLIIILLQLGPLFGFSASSSAKEALFLIPEYLNGADSPALMLGLVSLAIVLFCPRSISVTVPPPLLALVLGTLIYLLVFLDSGLTVIGAIPTGLPQLLMPALSLDLLSEMLFAALMLAVLGSIDSLLTSLVADNMTKNYHDSDRELIGQGVGNMMAGLFGGLPGAGATMRTVVNIKAGGSTPIAGVVHALVLVFVVLGAAPLAENIPHAVLAGILIKVGLDIIDWRFLLRLHHAPLFVAVLMLLVLCLTVLADLVTAVFVGVFIANVVTVKRLSDNQLDSIRIIDSHAGNDESLSKRERKLLAETRGRVVLYQFDGPVSYAAAKGLSGKLQDCRPHDALLLDFSRVPLIDVSTALAIEDMIVEAQGVGRNVHIIGLNPIVQEILQRLKILDLIPASFCHTKRSKALETAHAMVFRDELN
ncbi:SulP family inorganic anion transporter [Amphritea balenae]|uniref:SulP family inorganic anion transporter n=1 Tax=Amphritea balenae TaxID=452629 RepID=A0A3P1SL77_9GAMM|nr:SulP family inorganic anion transporter [Amphritea balenae]RRC97817.1 SulP family inorganic anion transporter [Amphritea balenae]GGK83233.1 sodium-independent anion transporter [Amphritea balenae]